MRRTTIRLCLRRTSPVTRSYFHPNPYFRQYSSVTSFVPKPEDDLLELNNTEKLFASKTTEEIAFSLFIFKLCANQNLITIGPQLLALAERSRLSSKMAYAVIRRTFFKQFCAGWFPNILDEYKLTKFPGESLDEAAKTVLNYKQNGVYSILDRSVEDARTVEDCNTNSEGLMEILAFRSKPPLDSCVNFIPIKITAYCPPGLLDRISSCILYKQYKQADFPLPWLRDEKFLPSRAFPWFSQQHPSPLNTAELKALDDVLARLARICNFAKERKVSLLFDAEQTRLQPAIIAIARLLSREHNRDFPVVFNTFQMYLKDNLQNLQFEIEQAIEGQYMLGAKIVRGAYMVSEAQALKAHNQPESNSVILESKQATDDAYDAGVNLLLQNIQHSSVVVATHNLNSTVNAVRRLQELNIDKSDPRVNFAQLMGMCDDLSLSLGREYYRVNKLLPFGKISDVMPYLIRRMQENSSVLGGTQRERELLQRELDRRRNTAIRRVVESESAEGEGKEFHALGNKHSGFV